MSEQIRQPSPLGRYDDDEREHDVHEVKLLRVPVRVMVASRQHHDELMREFSLLALSLEEQETNLPKRFRDLIDTLGRRYGVQTQRPDQLVDEALERGDEVIDLTYHVPSNVVEAADRLEQLMSEADAYCREEQMLTLARSPLQVRFAKWYLDEFRRQVAGAPPQPWDGPLEP
jgi:hypothetical protein